MILELNLTTELLKCIISPEFEVVMAYQLPVGAGSELRAEIGKKLTRLGFRISNLNSKNKNISHPY